jgi:hypothetical protein
MFKKFIAIGFLLASLFAIVWSGNYIYNKQLKKYNFYSYSVSDSAGFIYIPNSNVFLSKASQINLPKQINNNHLCSIFETSKKIKDFDFNSKVSTPTFISFDEINICLIFTNYTLTIESIKMLLKKELNIDTQIDNTTITINDVKLYHNKNQDYLVLSTVPIQPKQTNYRLIDVGNYDYFYQKSIASNPINYKHTANHTFSFWLSGVDTVKGQPIKSDKYYKSIPANFDTAYIYSSTRLKEDITTLTNISNQSDFYNWINESIIHLKKGNLELIIGEQNNNQYLKDILDEQTIELSSDSLLPTPIFKNNYEIHFFKSHYNWSNLLPQNTAEYLVFTENNNLNIIANSSQAMDWYIKEIQLGNTYYNKAIKIPITIKSHYLKIINSDSLINITEKVWINETTCFNSKIVTNQTQNEFKQNIILKKAFFTDFKINEINTFIYKDSLYIIGSNKKALICYNGSGKKLWQDELSSNLVNQPQLIITNNIPYIVIFEQNKINIKNLINGESLSPYPISFINKIITGQVLKYDDKSDYRLIFNVGNEILNYSINGIAVDGWNNYQINQKIKGQIHYQINNGKDYIYFTDNFDTIHVLNRRGISRFNQHYKINLPHQSKYITGDIEKGNLRCLGYNNNYIISQFLNDGHKDSLKVNIKTSSSQINWIQQNKKTYLVLEEFDKIYIINEFGLIENEILKPQPNLVYLNPYNNSKKIHFFGNINNNNIYLLNNFGKQINKHPINGNLLTSIKLPYIVSYVDSKLWIYKLKK